MTPNLSSQHFPPNRVLYEQVLFNLLSLVGVGRKVHGDSLSPRYIQLYKTVVQKIVPCETFEVPVVWYNFIQSFVATEIAKYEKPISNPVVNDYQNNSFSKVKLTQHKITCSNKYIW
jgi:hypothetical protein